MSGHRFVEHAVLGGSEFIVTYRACGVLLQQCNDRMGAVACWNAVMDENQYMVRKWNEFIAA